MLSMLTLLLARHGNTFEAGQPAPFIGSRTDLPLVTTGEQQAARLAAYLRQQHPVPEQCYAGALKRAQRTAGIIADTLNLAPPVITPLLSEIDFGDWEGLETPALQARYGAAFTAWQEQGLYPADSGWQETEEAIAGRVHTFLEQALAAPPRCILAVTSNGLARFFLRRNPATFHDLAAQHALKMATGAVSCLIFRDISTPPDVRFWNHRP